MSNTNTGRTFGRDPFARVEYREHSEKQSEGCAIPCAWCGTKAERIKTYQVESDGGRVSRIAGYFCSRSCFRAYHGQ